MGSYLKEGFTWIMNNLVCAGHTDIVVKLSATLPDVPGENLVCNVHGVRAEFLAIGRAITERPNGAYFLGKADYTKGYREVRAPAFFLGGAAGGPSCDPPYERAAAELRRWRLESPPLVTRQCHAMSRFC